MFLQIKICSSSNLARITPWTWWNVFTNKICSSSNAIPTNDRSWQQKAQSITYLSALRKVTLDTVKGILSPSKTLPLTVSSVTFHSCPYILLFSHHPKNTKSGKTPTYTPTQRRSGFFSFFSFLERFPLFEKTTKGNITSRKQQLSVLKIWRFHDKCLILQNLSWFPVPWTFRNKASKPPEDEGGRIFIEERNLTLVTWHLGMSQPPITVKNKAAGTPYGCVIHFPVCQGAQQKALFR